MTKLASIHFAKCRPGAAPERHNARQYSNEDFAPRYFLPEAQEPNTYKDLLEPENTDAAKAADNAKAYFDQVKAHYSGRGKRAKYDNCRREAILNLSESSTEDDVRGVVKYLEDKWHIKTTSYAIHRDEGYKDQDGTVHRNLHCHLVLETLYVDQQTGKPKQAWSEIGRAELHQIQDDIAKLMHMERTQTPGKPRKHLDRNSYVQIKEAQDRAAQATKQAEQVTAKAEALTAQATEAAAKAAQETQQAAKAKAEAAKQAQETARQAEQVRHDIETHKLAPSGLFVNKALRQANADQAEIIDTLTAKADATAAAHRQELIKKDEQIRIMHEASEDRRQTIRQLRQQIAERDETIRYQDATIRDQEKTIETQQTTIRKYDSLANTMYDVLEVLINAVPKKIVDTAINMLHAIDKLGVRNLWDRARDHKKREAAERLEKEQAAQARAEAAERQAEEARKSQGRGYGR